jgi:hypothetical protein
MLLVAGVTNRQVWSAVVCRQAGIAGALLNVIEAGPEFDPSEEALLPISLDDDRTEVQSVARKLRSSVHARRTVSQWLWQVITSNCMRLRPVTHLIPALQLDERFRCELTSLVWLLSLATAGNLLAISSDQTLVYARSLVKVCFLSSTAHQTRFCTAPANSLGRRPKLTRQTGLC